MKTVYVRFWFGSGSDDWEIEVDDNVEPTREWLNAERDKRNADWSDVITAEEYDP